MNARSAENDADIQHVNFAGNMTTRLSSLKDLFRCAWRLQLAKGLICDRGQHTREFAGVRGR